MKKVDVANQLAFFLQYSSAICLTSFILWKITQEHSLFQQLEICDKNDCTLEEYQSLALDVAQNTKEYLDLSRFVGFPLLFLSFVTIFLSQLTKEEPNEIFRYVFIPIRFTLLMIITLQQLLLGKTGQELLHGLSQAEKKPSQQALGKIAIYNQILIILNIIFLSLPLLEKLLLPIIDKVTSLENKWSNKLYFFIMNQILIFPQAYKDFFTDPQRTYIIRQYLYHQDFFNLESKADTKRKLRRLIEFFQLSNFLAALFSNKKTLSLYAPILSEVWPTVNVDFRDIIYSMRTIRENIYLFDEPRTAIQWISAFNQLLEKPFSCQDNEAKIFKKILPSIRRGDVKAVGTYLKEPHDQEIKKSRMISASETILSLILEKSECKKMVALFETLEIYFYAPKTYSPYVQEGQIILIENSGSDKITYLFIAGLAAFNSELANTHPEVDHYYNTMLSRLLRALNLFKISNESLSAYIRELCRAYGAPKFMEQLYIYHSNSLSLSLTPGQEQAWLSRLISCLKSHIPEKDPALLNPFFERLSALSEKTTLKKAPISKKAELPAPIIEETSLFFYQTLYENLASENESALLINFYHILEKSKQDPAVIAKGSTQIKASLFSLFLHPQKVTFILGRPKILQAFIDFAARIENKNFLWDWLTAITKMAAQQNKLRLTYFQPTQILFLLQSLPASHRNILLTETNSRKQTYLHYLCDLESIPFKEKNDLITDLLLLGVQKNVQDSDGNYPIHLYISLHADILEQKNCHPLLPNNISLSEIFTHTSSGEALLISLLSRAALSSTLLDFLYTLNIINKETLAKIPPQENSLLSQTIKAGHSEMASLLLTLHAPYYDKDLLKCPNPLFLFCAQQENYPASEIPRMAAALFQNTTTEALFLQLNHEKESLFSKVLYIETIAFQHLPPFATVFSRHFSEIYTTITQYFHKLISDFKHSVKKNTGNKKQLLARAKELTAWLSEGNFDYALLEEAHYHFAFRSLLDFQQKWHWYHAYPQTEKSFLLALEWLESPGLFFQEKNFSAPALDESEQILLDTWINEKGLRYFIEIILPRFSENFSTLAPFLEKTFSESTSLSLTQVLAYIVHYIEAHSRNSITVCLRQLKKPLFLALQRKNTLADFVAFLKLQKNFFDFCNALSDEELQSLPVALINAFFENDAGKWFEQNESNAKRQAGGYYHKPQEIAHLLLVQHNTGLTKAVLKNLSILLTEHHRFQLLKESISLSDFIPLLFSLPEFFSLEILLKNATLQKDNPSEAIWLKLNEELKIQYYQKLLAIKNLDLALHYFVLHHASHAWMSEEIRSHTLIFSQFVSQLSDQKHTAASLSLYEAVTDFSSLSPIQKHQSIQLYYQQEAYHKVAEILQTCPAHEASPLMKTFFQKSLQQRDYDTAMIWFNLFSQKEQKLFYKNSFSGPSRETFASEFILFFKYANGDTAFLLQHFPNKIDTAYLQKHAISYLHLAKEIASFLPENKSILGLLSPSILSSLLETILASTSLFSKDFVEIIARCCLHYLHQMLLTLESMQVQLKNVRLKAMNLITQITATNIITPELYNRLSYALSHPMIYQELPEEISGNFTIQNLLKINNILWAQYTHNISFAYIKKCRTSFFQLQIQTALHPKNEQYPLSSPYGAWPYSVLLTYYISSWNKLMDFLGKQQPESSAFFIGHRLLTLEAHPYLLSVEHRFVKYSQIILNYFHRESAYGLPVFIQGSSLEEINDFLETLSVAPLINQEIPTHNLILISQNHPFLKIADIDNHIEVAGDNYDAFQGIVHHLLHNLATLTGIHPKEPFFSFNDGEWFCNAKFEEDMIDVTFNRQRKARVTSPAITIDYTHSPSFGTLHYLEGQPVHPHLARKQNILFINTNDYDFFTLDPAHYAQRALFYHLLKTLFRYQLKSVSLAAENFPIFQHALVAQSEAFFTKVLQTYLQKVLLKIKDPDLEKALWNVIEHFWPEAPLNLHKLLLAEKEKSVGGQENVSLVQWHRSKAASEPEKSLPLVDASPATLSENRKQVRF